MGLLKLNRTPVLIYGLPLLVILSSIFIALSPLLKQYPELATAITYDLTLTAPLLFLLLARKKTISKLKVVPFFIGGTILASYLLPESGQEHLNILKTYALPVVELAVLAILISKILKAIKIFKSHSLASADFASISKKSVIELLGKSRFAAFLSSEITMMYYALISWNKKKPTSKEFTNYKENASIALGGALLMVVFIETFTLHVLLAKSSVIAAWILTGTSIYTAFFIVAHIKALWLRPSLLTDENLVLKNGLIADIQIDLNAIEKIEECSKELKSETLKIGNLGLFKESANHNIALYLKKPQTIEKMYGFTEECDVLLFRMDNSQTFTDNLNAAIEKTSR